MQTKDLNWKSSASVESLKARAKITKTIRSFFDERDCYEVTTPVMSQFGNTEPNIESFEVNGFGYLNTSPEFHMKRLLAGGSGAIYQVCQSFRKEEIGKKHNCEFTMLEWYRPNWSIEQLMQELIDLLHQFLPVQPVIYQTYEQALKKYTGINCYTDDLEVIEKVAQNLLGEIPNNLEKDELLDLLFCLTVEPQLPKNAWCFITQYPPSQASLAKKIVNEHGQEVAMRFELYSNSMELANGYWELTDAFEQNQRFDADNKKRAQQGQPKITKDELLIEALNAPMPECSGVAVGLDRIMMLALKCNQINQVISFDSTNA